MQSSRQAAQLASNYPKTAPADAAWNSAATKTGYAAAAAQAKPQLAAVPSAPPSPGDPLPPHLDNLWPGGTYISQTDRKEPFGIERISIIQPGPNDLPYPIRIHEYFPDNPKDPPVLVSEVIADRVLVGRPAGWSDQKFEIELQALSKVLGGVQVNRLTESGVYQVIIAGTPSADTVTDAVKFIQTRFPVPYAELDPVQRMSLMSNDPMLIDGSLWGLHNTGQNSGTVDADIDAPEGWDIRNSAANIVVGVIDTGVLYTHEDIADNMWVNPGEIPGNGIDDDGNGYIDDVYGINAITNTGDPRDDQGHGTHCAGTIAAVGNNGVGVAGVAWQAKIMALKFLSASGSGATSDAVKCVEYARLKGAHLTSNSWGGGGAVTALEQAIRDAANAGQLFIVAAGNDSKDNDFSPTYPASYPVRNIVAVAATDRNDAMANFSNYGFGTVHIGAPGVAIRSLGIADNSSYRDLSGTSMATPHVAGVAALLRAHFPSDTGGQILNRILNSGDAISSTANTTLSGRRLNLRNALTSTNRPFNDDFANGRLLPRNELFLQTTYANASPETSNITDGIANGPAVWFRFVTATAGNVTVTTGGSSFDTVLGVYSGDAITNLTPVATNDNTSGGGVTSALTFSADANVVYHIAVTGKGGAEGYLQLNVSGPVENDHLANASIMTVPSGAGGHNRTATKEPGEPNHAGNAGGKSVWYKFTPPSTGYYTFTTGGESSFREASTFDTLLAIYAGPASNPTMGDLIPVASNDNDPSGYFTTSLVGFRGTAGQTYYIAIDGKNGAGGDIRFAGFPIPDHDYFQHAMPLHGDNHVINTSDRIATTEPGEPNHNGAPPRYTLWYDFVPETSGTFELDTIVTSGSKTSHAVGISVYQGNSLGNLTLVTQGTGGTQDYDTILVLNNAVAGQSYKIAVSDYSDFAYPLLGPVGMRIRKVEPILNDNFADAITVPNPPANGFSTVTGQNRGATLEPGEPVWSDAFGNTGNNTVWWKWTANISGQMQVNTIGSTNPESWSGNFDTLLWVYTGSSVNNLTQIAFDDNSGGFLNSLATFNATVGTTYYFRVAGFQNAGGNIVLNLGRHVVPGDNFEDPIVVTEPNMVFQQVQNAGATLQSGDPVIPGVTNRSRSLWFRYTATQSGPLVFSTMGGQWSGVGVYTGSSLGSLTEVVSNGTGVNGRPQAEVRWNAVAGTTYHIMVVLKFNEGQGNPYPYVITFLPLTNDNFENPIVLTGSNVSVTAHNFQASKQSGEPNHAGNAGGRSVWFSWTAPTSGTYAITTAGSTMRDFETNYNRTRELDTLLAVYTGSALNALTPVASNDDMGASDKGSRLGVTSGVMFEATAGTTYRIAVDGRNYTYWDGSQNQTVTGDWGQIILNIAATQRPANDDFANAEVISSAQLPFLRTTDISTFGATKEAGEPNHAGQAARSNNTLWFRFTAPETRTYFASTSGNFYNDLRARDTVVAVYTGSAVNALTQVAAAAGNLPFGFSEVSFNAIAGTTYHIAIGAATGGPMSFILVPEPANNNYANATQMWGSRFIATGYNVGASAEPGEWDPYQYWYGMPRTGTRRSVWWKWTAPVTGAYTIETYNSDLAVTLSIHGTGGPTATHLWRQEGVAFDPLNFLVTGKKDSYDRRRRGTMVTTQSFTAGQTYYFRIAGDGFNNDHSGTIQLELTGPPAPPPTPLALNGVRINASTTQLSWQDLSMDESGYELQRSTDNATWTTVGTLPANTTSFTDVGAPAADLYYRLRATSSLGNSDWVSTLVTMPAPPAAPTGFTATGASMTSIALSWNAVANAASLRLERSGTGQWGPWTLVNGAISGNATSFSDTGLETNKTYWYRLRGTNAQGNGPWSAVASASTLNTATLVEDRFNDGGHTNGADPLDVAWSQQGGALTVTTDSQLDSGTPANVLRVSTTTTEGDIYAYFTLPGGNQTLAVGESLRLSFRIRHTGTPRTDDGRTGFSLAFSPSNNPWAETGKREYMVRTTYGSTATLGRIVRTQNVQVVNSNASDVTLGSGHAGINAGTSAFNAWMEVERTGDSSVIVRYQLGNGTVFQAVDTGASIITTFNRVFFRFRTVAGTTDPQFHIDDVIVTKAVAGSPSPGQHPIVPWRQTHFGIPSNSGNAADTADPDGDGVPNLLEFALGSNPAESGSRAVPEVGIIQVSGQNRLTLSFTPDQVGGLRYFIQASTDLVNWNDEAEVTSQLHEGELFIHVDSANLGTTPRRFLRLRVQSLE